MGKGPGAGGSKQITGRERRPMRFKRNEKLEMQLEQDSAGYERLGDFIPRSKGRGRGGALKDCKQNKVNIHLQ